MRGACDTPTRPRDQAHGHVKPTPPAGPGPATRPSTLIPQRLPAGARQGVGGGALASGTAGPPSAPPAPSAASAPGELLKDHDEERQIENAPKCVSLGRTGHGEPTTAAAAPSPPTPTPERGRPLLPKAFSPRPPGSPPSRGAFATGTGTSPRAAAGSDAGALCAFQDGPLASPVGSMTFSFAGMFVKASAAVLLLGLEATRRVHGPSSNLSYRSQDLVCNHAV